MRAIFKAQCPLCAKCINRGDEISPHPSKNVKRWVHSKCVNNRQQKLF